jgi:hypothetical protein
VLSGVIACHQDGSLAEAGQRKFDIAESWTTMK